MTGCGTAYYLVHSMASGTGSFRERDLQAARNFASAAAEAHVERIIYLGGLGRRSEQLSNHLSSRHEVGDVLRAGSVPATELRAAMIIGSGSASFEMLRSLVSRLPVMICPRWVANRTQPIAIRSVLAYLIGCMENPATAGQVFDIGGPEVLTYKEMMERFARILGCRRWMIVVPVLTPRLSAYWVNLVTPVPASIAFPLIEGLKSETVCEDDRIKGLVAVEPIGFDDAVRLAMAGAPATRGRDPLDEREHADPRRAIGAGSTRRTSRSATSNESRATHPPRPCSTGFDGSVATWAGITPTPSGRYEAGWIASSAASDFGGVVATPTTSSSATPSISGGSRT